MKKLYISLVFVILITDACFAQNVGIGTSTPNASSILEIKASNKGLLIPRTSTASRTAIVNPAKGLMVYDTTTSTFWYHNGIAWTQIDGAGTCWSLIGNANTDSLVNFVGTTNAEALVFKVNNQRSGFIGYSTSNTSFGYNAFSANTTGNYNTANGTYALSANNAGNNNTANGSYALLNNTTGGYNLASGSDALHNNTTGYFNTASGTAALYFNIAGSNNAGYGNNTLHNNTTGFSNVAVGTVALYSNTDRSNLVAIGDSALYNNGVNESSPADATGNTAIGSKALYSNTIGYENTAIGYHALFFNINGNYNTAIGYRAGVDSPNITNATAIGAEAFVLTSNTIQLGDDNVTSVNTNGAVTARGYMCKPGVNGDNNGNNFNINWSGGAAQLWIDVTNLGNISTTSDRRLKENIDLMKAIGIERMMELKPVHFKYKKIEGTIFSGGSQEQEGFIADELQQVIPSAVNGEKNALTSKGTIQPQTINIVPVVAVLTKAAQEQQQIIEDQNKKIDLQQQQINILLNDIEQLKQKINKLVK